MKVDRIFSSFVYHHTRKRVLNFMSKAGGQFAETRSLLAAISFAFVRNRLGNVMRHHKS